MITVRLQGGMGNQMFQYACGRAIAIKRKFGLILDPTQLDKASVPRHYQLGPFNIQANIATITSGNVKVVSERHFHYDPGVFDIHDTNTLIGYFQSEKYFIGIADVIRKDFTLRTIEEQKLKKNKLGWELFKRAKSCNSVSVLIRRGDYVTNSQMNKFHGVCSLDYYNECMDYIASKVEHPMFFLLTDDPEWVAEHMIPKYPHILATNGSLLDYQEMILASHCKHHITSNSTFGWWGAWLGSNPNKIICAPKQWFVDTSMNTSDLIPRSWVRL